LQAFDSRRFAAIGTEIFRLGSEYFLPASVETPCELRFSPREIERWR